jgi:uncharacterized caspase-like protein
MYRWLNSVVVWAVLGSGIGVCQAADRVALVIGNSKYVGDAALRNPANDADAIEAALKDLDFNVIKKNDLDLEQMKAALIDFQEKIPKGGLGLFYYAGHGLQLDGANFLVPISARIQEEADVKRQCLEVGDVLNAMVTAECKVKVLVLDSSRNNPFKVVFKPGDKTLGLAALGEIPPGTLLAYSTSPGKAADYGNAKTSPYAAKLVAALRSRPAGGLEIKDVFFEASRAVKQATGQTPWLNFDGSLEKYYLRAAAADSKP